MVMMMMMMMMMMMIKEESHARSSHPMESIVSESYKCIIN